MFQPTVDLTQSAAYHIFPATIMQVDLCIIGALENGPAEQKTVEQPTME